MQDFTDFVECALNPVGAATEIARLTAALEHASSQIAGYKAAQATNLALIDDLTAECDQWKSQCLEADFQEAERSRMLDEARAEVAMAFEVAAENCARKARDCEKLGFTAYRDAYLAAQDGCKALTPAHATAALAARDREMMAKGARLAAEQVEEHAPGGEKYESGHDDASTRVSIREAILALADRIEAGEEVDHE